MKGQLIDTVKSSKFFLGTAGTRPSSQAPTRSGDRARRGGRGGFAAIMV